ncbi:hypothetical protein HZF08_29660 [Paenibacillus sp. CGMCC 1.16610]|uniref:DUF4375 domain-containing protein n=1 Tax=Paenibacillus anseongense TaxID=2682845 RepID=A0ABW9U5L1_9BACL|nr:MULTISPECIES: hypothetical protein [Paenibacillus]MBA2942446.1 hypothetical protein [Paenibacillus sp. CGMCC 1.16610]MVQ34520.1 hypothetical protein [Paenibacillus anseongense]
MKLPIFIVLLVCFLLVSTLLVNRDFRTVDQEIDHNLNNISIGPGVSSNPYDYITDNEAFENIVSLGSEALPALHNKLSMSDENGLKEYYLAVAIEQIAGVDLKQSQSTFWDTPNGFIQMWSRYLETIPSHVDEISKDANLSQEERVKQLIKLGTPAVPFILDEIELGDEGLLSAFNVLTRNSAATADILDKKAWASENKDQFAELKRYVLEKRN